MAKMRNKCDADSVTNSVTISSPEKRREEYIEERERTARATLADVVAHPWFAVGLPPEALSMNDACLALRPHAHPGYQTVDAVRAVVRDAARAAPAAADADDAIIEDVLGDEDGLEGRPSACLEPE